MKKIYISMLVCLLLVACTSKPLELNEFDFYNPIIEVASQSSITFEKFIPYCDVAIVGTIEDNLVHASDIRNFYSLKVESQVFGGDIPEDIEDIIVGTNYSQLDIGSTYLLLLTLNQSTADSHDYYYANSFWIFKIEADQVLLLVDTRNKTYVPPFKNDEYNKLPQLSQYMAGIHRKSSQAGHERQSFIEKASFEDMVILSDFIGIVRVNAITEPLSFDSVRVDDYTIVKSYKGSTINLPSMLVFPAGTEVGREYLAFMRGVVPTARHNSIISQTDPEYTKFMDLLQMPD